MKKVIIYIEERELRAVLVPAGRGAQRNSASVHGKSGTQYHSVPIQAGCVKNGMIEDKDLFVAAMEELVQNSSFPIKKAVLELQTGCVSTKNMDIPARARAHEILYAVRAEFAAFENEADLVYDYIEICPVPGSKRRKIIGGCMERNVVKSFAECFLQAGIKLTGINVVNPHGAEAGRKRSKTFNFLAASKRKERKTMEQAGTFGNMVKIAGIFGAGLILTFGILAVGNIRMEKRLGELTAYTEDKLILEKYYEKLRVREIGEIYEDGIRCVGMANLKEYVENGPDGELIMWIEGISGAESCLDYRYSGEEGTFSFTCLTDDYHKIPDYVEELRSGAAFSDVLYSGYTRDEGTGKYRFSISCEIVGQKGDEQIVFVQ